MDVDVAEIKARLKSPGSMVAKLGKNLEIAVKHPANEKLRRTVAAHGLSGFSKNTRMRRNTRARR